MSTYEYEYHREIHIPPKLVASIFLGIVSLLCSGIYYCCCRCCKTQTTPVRAVATPQTGAPIFAQDNNGVAHTTYQSTVPDPSSNGTRYPTAVPNPNGAGACNPGNTLYPSVIIPSPSGTPCQAPQTGAPIFAQDNNGVAHTTYQSTVPDPSSNGTHYPTAVPNPNGAGACNPRNTLFPNVITPSPSGTPCLTVGFENMYQDRPPTYDQTISSNGKHNASQ